MFCCNKSLSSTVCSIPKTFKKLKCRLIMRAKIIDFTLITVYFVWIFVSGQMNTYLIGSLTNIVIKSKYWAVRIVRNSIHTLSHASKPYFRYLVFHSIQFNKSSIFLCFWITACKSLSHRDCYITAWIMLPLRFYIFFSWFFVKKSSIQKYNFYFPNQPTCLIESVWIINLKAQGVSHTMTNNMWKCRQEIKAGPIAHKYGTFTFCCCLP